MNRKQVLITLGVAACVVLLFALLRVAHHGGDTDDAEEAVPSIVTVETGKLARATLHAYVEGFGTVTPAPAEEGRPAASARLAAPVAGVLAEVKVGEGQRVEKGEVLFQLESRAADVAVDFAKKTVDRQQALLRMNNTSQKAVEDAEQQLATAQAQQALLRIKAPLSGTVTHVNVRPGEAVDLTTPLADIVDLSRLVISANIPAAEAGRVKAGQPVELQTDPPVTTTLSFVSPAVDAASDSVSIRAAAPDGGGLRAGQFVKLRIATEEHTNCLAAPEASVVTDGDGNPVIAVVTNYEAALTTVKTGLRENGLVEIEGAGLKEGDTVVTLGAYGLPKKTKVRFAAP